MENPLSLDLQQLLAETIEYTLLDLQLNIHIRCLQR